MKILCKWDNVPVYADFKTDKPLFCTPECELKWTAREAAKAEMSAQQRVYKDGEGVCEMSVQPPSVDVDLNSPRLTMPSPSGEIGIKHDAGKDRWDLVPWEVIEQFVKVLSAGAAEYGDNNWRLVEPHRFKAAIWRHWCDRFVRGEVYDKKSKLPHTAHMLCNIVFLAVLLDKESEK